MLDSIRLAQVVVALGECVTNGSVLLNLGTNDVSPALYCSVPTLCGSHEPVFVSRTWPLTSRIDDLFLPLFCESFFDTIKC